MAYSNSFAQTTITSNNFENCETGYTEFGAYSDGSSDYFVRANGTTQDTNCTTTVASGQITFSNASGYYYTGEDTERLTENPNTGGDFGSTALSSGVHFNDIDVSSFTNVQIVCSFAASTAAAFENDDYVRIYVDKTNNATYELVAAFESVGAAGNVSLSQDTDLNGSGDGTVLTQVFQSFTFSISGATTMDVRIELFSSTGNEEIAFDTFIVQGTAAVTSTTWNGTTWSNSVPTASVDAVIASSTTPATAVICKDLTINSGITLTMGANDLTVSGDLANNGNGISSTGTITFNKSGTSTISGSTVSHGGVVSVSSGATLNTGGFLTLTAASASSYGQLVGDGTVSGNVNVQAYLDGINASTARYFYLGSPCTNATLSDFNEGNIMVASSGATGTVWEFNATTGTWAAPSSISNTASSGQGFAMYVGGHTTNGTFIRGTAGTIQLTGTVTTTDVGRAISYHNGQGGSQTFVGGTAEADTEGWNLVANPFPAVYNWDAQTIPTDMSTAIYRYDGTNYSSYAKGAGGGSQYIAPFQAVFVQLTANTAGTLTFAENNRITGQSATLGKNAVHFIDGIDLFIENQSTLVSDQLFIGYDNRSTKDFDLEYDAHKLLNSGGVPSLFTRDHNNTYSITRVNPKDNITSFPVFVKHGVDGDNLTFNVDLSRLQSYSTVKLEDLKTGNFHDLGSSDYHFIHDASFKEDRFILHFASSQTVGIQELSLSASWFTYNTENGININSGKLNRARIEVYSISGELIYSTNAEEEITSIPLASKGVYLVQLSTATSTDSKKIIH